MEERIKAPSPGFFHPDLFFVSSGFPVFFENFFKSGFYQENK